jgi:hypothetical protein
MKARKSILDAHAAKLADWEAESLTLAQMCERLAEAGCKVSPSRVSDYLSRSRSDKMRADLLTQISTGAQQIKDVEEQFSRNPAPGLETLIKLNRVLILKLSTMGNADPSLIELATSLTKTAMDYEKLNVKREELELTREKFEHLKALAERAGETERALDADLTAEERAQRIKEIYGRA